jgi:hypothetical protein
VLLLSGFYSKNSKQAAIKATFSIALAFKNKCQRILGRFTDSP